MTDIVTYIKEQLTMVKVKNVEGHYEVPSGYDSWLDYWEKNKKEKATQCEKQGCGETGKLVGGHVHKEGDDDTVYLVPICYDHNHYTEIGYYKVPEDKLLLVPPSDLVPVKDTLDEWLGSIQK